jgi:predicted transcriptional regulator
MWFEVVFEISYETVLEALHLLSRPSGESFVFLLVRVSSTTVQDQLERKRSRGTGE